jgi:hypothetical protein
MDAMDYLVRFLRGSRRRAFVVLAVNGIVISALSFVIFRSAFLSVAILFLTLFVAVVTLARDRY